MSHNNNQKNAQKNDSQEEEHYFYPNAVINCQNQEQTEAGGSPPTHLNTNLQKEISESNQNSIPKPKNGESTQIHNAQTEKAYATQISKELPDFKTKAKVLLIEESKSTETGPRNNNPVL